MLSGRGEKESQAPLGSLHSDLSPGQRIQNLIQLVEQHAPLEQIQQAEYHVAEAMKQHPFEVRRQLPLFLNLVRKLDATRAFQQFRLPGRNRVVVDRREGRERGRPKEAVRAAAKEAAKEAAEKKGAEKVGKEAAGALHLKEGKLVQRAKRHYEGYFAGRDMGRGGIDQEVAAERVERMLSAFEKMLLARFEGGKQVAQESPDGKARFLAKSESQWKNFFKQFLHRTVQKKTLLSDIREFLLRGILPRGEKGIFIGDMHFVSGRIEKFVRFSIIADALARLKALTPGKAFERGMLEGLLGEELVYLALTASRAPRLATSEAASQGKFMGARAEAAAAEALGVPIDQHLHHKARRLRKGAHGFSLGNLLGGEEAGEELPSQFIPWWRWGNLIRPGKLRWVTAVFYGTLLALALIGVATLTWRLMGGMSW